jgi:hypothetical protein
MAATIDDLRSCHSRILRLGAHNISDAEIARDWEAFLASYEFCETDEEEHNLYLTTGLREIEDYYANPPKPLTEAEQEALSRKIIRQMGLPLLDF